MQHGVLLIKPEQGLVHGTVVIPGRDPGIDVKKNSGKDAHIKGIRFGLI
jgi:hypothetical protein